MKHIEQYAYEYSSIKGYDIPTYPNRSEVIAMKDLFNMTAGTSTGSIISAGLSYPLGDSEEERHIPKFFAKEVVDIYVNNGDMIFSKSEGASDLIKVLIFLVFVAVWGVLFFFIGRHYYDNPKVIKEFKKMNSLITDKKRNIKGHHDDKKNKKQKSRLEMVGGMNILQ